MKATGWIALLVTVAVAGGGGYWLGHHASAAPDKDDAPAEGGKADEVKPVATVTVVPLRKTTIDEDVIAYGTIVAPPSETRVVSVPFESRVTKVLVAPGETVKAGQPLVEVEGSAATKLAVEEASNAQAAAERDLQAVQQRYDQKLATNADLYTAENNLRTAQGRLKSLQQGGAGAPSQLKAESDGIVSKVDVQIGQVVPIGNPLIEVAAQNRIEADLGVEPADAVLLKVGQPVKLEASSATDARPVPGTLRLIGQRVDPATRLVDVRASLPQDARLLLDSFVVATIARTLPDVLVVPRDAALPNEEGGYELFTVKDGKAVKHSVRLGIENDHEVQVISDDLALGDQVVIVGNYELEDGMAVRSQAATTEPSTTEPSTTEPAGGATTQESAEGRS
jgi:membrane fusion protein (multidrug efflux system)